MLNVKILKREREKILKWIKKLLNINKFYLDMCKIKGNFKCPYHCFKYPNKKY